MFLINICDSIALLSVCSHSKRVLAITFAYFSSFLTHYLDLYTL